MTLTPVTVINANKGYVVYGPVGNHDFHPTSRTCDKATILEGNPGKEAMDKNNNNGYVLSYKTSSSPARKASSTESNFKDI